MRKMIEFEITRLAALRVILCFGVLAFVPGGIAEAEDFVPLPPKKPFMTAVYTVPVPGQKPPSGGFEKAPSISSDSSDVTDELLKFGSPPVPPEKPFTAPTEPFSKEDAARYKKIFALQSAGKMKEAAREMAALRDMRLRGHVLYQRYMHPSAYISSFEELQRWLVLYADHPGAAKIYQLARRKGSGPLVRPKAARQIVNKGDPTVSYGRRYLSRKKRSGSEKKTVQSFKKSIYSLVNRTRPTQAYKKLQTHQAAGLLDKVEYDLLKARIATGYLHAGKISNAFTLASEATDRSGLNVPEAGWVAGLVAWVRGDYETAAGYFEVPARSSYVSGWMASAGSYWAARSYMRSGKVRKMGPWLKRAASNPRTFYGLIATRAQGRDFDFNWDIPAFTAEYETHLLSIPAGLRAAALIKAGQPHLAEAELLQIDIRDDMMRAALFAYADHAGLPGLAMRLGSSAFSPEGRYYDAALYPKGSWPVAGGYTIDPALIHAIMRQESRFDPMAESPSGAKGLMQLLPSTASFVAGSRALRSKTGQYQLMDPETNLEIAQKYLGSLLNHKYVRGDILSLLISYNAGPGNLSRWRRQWRSVEDDLLFIELIPSRETRTYVERVLANYWIYRMRAGLKTPTLDALAAGEPALYAGDFRDGHHVRVPAVKVDEENGYKVVYND